MFVIDNFPEITFHIKTNLKRFKKLSSGWYESFCPYCNDEFRKFNPSHGHLHIAPNFPFAHCFRCGTKIGLDKLLIDTGFNNKIIIDKLRSISGFTYNKSKITGLSSEQSIQSIQNRIIDSHIWTLKNYPNLFEKYCSYLKQRCLDIDPTKFLIFPFINKNIIQVRFLNYNGELICARNIDSVVNRYEVLGGQKKYYYFQDILKIDQFQSIVITEGAFDIINLYNYYYPFRNSFFISIGGNNYKGIITDIINTFLLIGKYTIKSVFDKDLKFKNRTINSIRNHCNVLNPEINLEFYEPTLTKDVSEIMLLERIN